MDNEPSQDQIQLVGRAPRRAQGMERYKRDVGGPPRHEPRRAAAQPAHHVRQEGHAVHGDGETRAYEFDLRESAVMSWEDRFQQLAEWKREHGNFDVPGDDEDGEGKYKFYKWVTRLHNEYRGERDVIVHYFDVCKRLCRSLSLTIHCILHNHRSISILPQPTRRERPQSSTTSSWRGSRASASSSGGPSARSSSSVKSGEKAAAEVVPDVAAAPSTDAASVCSTRSNKSTSSKRSRSRRAAARQRRRTRPGR